MSRKSTGGNFLFEVRSRYKELRPSEQKTADVILENNEEMVNWSIEELARKAGVSQPTIIRFAKAMGLGGYRELKNRMLEERVQRQHFSAAENILEYPVKKEDKLVEIPAKVIRTNIRHLEEVLKAVSTYEYVRAVEALENAENISVYAVENSSCTAEDFTTKMAYIGKQVYFNKDGYMQKVNAKNLTPRDVAIGISHTGKSKHTVEALKCAKESGAVTISITNFEKAVINKYADIVLCTENSQYMYGNAIFSRSAQISIVDMLYLGAFLTNYDYYADRLNRSWSNIQDLVYEKDDKIQ
ncbi:MAG: MurR/RpiR family transcriptional regulator [Ruminococcus sp.]|jgi:DNA-binding MurR/RpiR family transcriptional regulator